MKTTIEEAEKIVGRKLLVNEKSLVAMFGDNEKYRFAKDKNGKLSTHIKEEYR